MNRRPERTPLDWYLDRICRRLWFTSARERRDTREELSQHLESMAAHATRTVSATEAMEDAMEKFGDPKQIAKDLSRQHLRRRRWLSALLKTAAGVGLTLLVLVVGYSGYWYFALSKPMEREATPTPLPSAAATLAAIQAAQDGYARQIQSVRFQGSQTYHTYSIYNGNKVDEGQTKHTYEVASKGALYYSREVGDSRYGTKPNETTHTDEVWTFDGRAMRQVLTEWNGPVDSIRSRQTYHVSAYLPGGGFKPHGADEVLQWGYKVDGVWIGDMLRRGRPSVEGTVTDARFGPLTVMRCASTTPQGQREAVRLWLAPRLGWMAVKTDVQEPGGRSPFTLQATRETRQVVRVGALWVASEGQFKYNTLGLGRRQEVGNLPRHFTNITLNDVPDSLFVPHYPAGTRFWTQATDAHPSLPTTLEEYQAAPAVAEQNVSSLWLYELAGVVLLSGVGFAVLRARRRGQRQTA